MSEKVDKPNAPRYALDMETPDGITQADLAVRPLPAVRRALPPFLLRDLLAAARAGRVQARNLREAAERALARGDVGSAAFCLSRGVESLLTAYRAMGRAWGVA